ncbi:MAG: ABC transporter permease, partial [Thermoleophilaceae bacterium]|nr:ABC transporter permease [Thermoleophilaceae bacterium]
MLIAIGIAVFAGLGGMRGWREQSARDSFAALKYHDLRVSLTEGSFAKAGELKAALRALPDASIVTASQERLLAPTQIDTSATGPRVFAPGLIVGAPVGANGGSVDTVQAKVGRTLRADESREPLAVLDRSFARFYKLPTSGTIQLAGNQQIEYVGQGQSPQYFLITSETGFGGESTQGTLFTSLETAQRLARRPDQTNELALRLRPGVDQQQAKRLVKAALASSLPQLGATVTLGTEESAHQILFRDAKNDQRMMTFFGLLVLFGACVAAFNLVSRAVEAERREIGIGMALGVQPAQLALRPLALGTQIALLGTLIGAGLTVWLAGTFASIYETLLPLPAYANPFRPGVYLRGALIGFALPFAAIIWPVVRGTRVMPIEAIRVGIRSAGSGGWAPFVKRVRLPGGSVGQMAIRNV